MPSLCKVQQAQWSEVTGSEAPGIHQGDACSAQRTGDDVAVANLASARLRIFREDEGDLLVPAVHGAAYCAD